VTRLRAALVAFSLLAAGCSAAATSTELPPSASVPLIHGWERYFTLDWQAGTKQGRPVIDGYVFNDWGFTARDVRLLVQSLDRGGNVVAQTIGYVPLGVAPGTHAYFEVPLRQPAAAYRVIVASWDWVTEGGVFRRRFP
jgi:hypothetical protein